MEVSAEVQKRQQFVHLFFTEEPTQWLAAPPGIMSRKETMCKQLLFGLVTSQHSSHNSKRLTTREDPIVFRQGWQMRNTINANIQMKRKVDGHCARWKRFSKSSLWEFHMTCTKNRSNRTNPEIKTLS
jgi:hypothetical protein